MADEFNSSGNWWESTRSRFESGTPSSSSGVNNLGSFAWATDMADIKARTTIDTMSVSPSSVVFQDIQKLQGHESAGGSDPNLQMMGLGLSTQAMDWNQAILRGEKANSGFRSMLQDNLNSNTSFQQETGLGSSHLQWRERFFPAISGGESSGNEFKQANRGFSLDQPPFSPQYSSGDSTVTSQGMPSSFQMDSALYGSPSTILQGLLGPDNQPQQPSIENRQMNFPYPANYGVLNSSEMLPSWSKVTQFLRTSPPKQPPHSQLHFSNNAPFWNASEAAMKDVRPNFFPSLQPQFPPSNFDEKPKNICEVRESASVGKKSGNEATSKRPRNEPPSPLPAFKVRKEKMGDRITALQQLVSPFGKTDTASVLSEAIEYIKFLHDQVSVLSTPYMKSGVPIQHQQNSDNSNDPEGPKQDLRSRGLCLVPVSSTFPVTHETTVDFWTPTFGGTFR